MRGSGSSLLLQPHEDASAAMGFTRIYGMKLTSPGQSKLFGASAKFQFVIRIVLSSSSVKVLGKR
jgi:hypothetical protein